MNRRTSVVMRWPLLGLYLSIMGILPACGVSGAVTPTAVTPEATVAAVLRWEDGAVKAQSMDTTWVPVAGEATFELVGAIESTNPWMVTGNTFAIRESTQIADGLDVEDVVRVKGIILSDNTWLASSIELAGAQEPQNPVLILIGKVDSLDPWVIHGITLNVTDDTVVNDEITTDMLVGVEILLLDDGTWEVLSISALSRFTPVPGCATVTATVASVSGNEVQFAGWPIIVLPEDATIEDEAGQAAALIPGEEVLVVVCAADDGQFKITKIVVLQTSDDEDTTVGEKVLVCHKPEKKGGHTLSIAEPAVAAHLGHGDTLGACP